MIGRRVREFWGTVGTVERWEPLGAAMCDALVIHDDGSRCWYASHSLTPIDGLGPLPSRRVAREHARESHLRSLRAIRRQHVAAFDRERWPGCEFAKAIVGRMIDGAIADVEGEA